MKLFHTSDWHLGRSLFAKKRYAEFQLFLDWLITLIGQQSPDILIIAGDVFDSSTPSNKAQEMYYHFLCQVATTTNCQHVVVIAGNHDSPSLLNAPAAILKQLQIHVVGNITDNLSDEVLLLRDRDAQPLAIIGAVPYLRDRDLRTIEDNETAQDKDLRLMQAIKNHYWEVCTLAQKQRESMAVDIPLIALGHLFVAGGKTEADDGVRELYVGSLARFGAGDFPPWIDYLALGHLHTQQIINGKEDLRYSGSPIAMGFGEIHQEKNILSVKFTSGNKPVITRITVPRFQALARISGDLATLKTELELLCGRNESIWVEASYTGKEIVANLNQQLQATLAGSQVELIKLVNNQLVNQISLSLTATNEVSLADVTPLQVFEQCLAQNEVPSQQQSELIACYQLVLHELQQTDVKAE